MNKHNIIEFCDYKQNKGSIKQEHKCYKFLDTLSHRINMANTYFKNFGHYLECLVRDGNIKQEFADNLKIQAELMVKELKG